MFHKNENLEAAFRSVVGHGGHYFDPDTLHFWRVKFGKAYTSISKLYVVFAESVIGFDGRERVYKVSRVDLRDGRVESLDGEGNVGGDLYAPDRPMSMKRANERASLFAMEM
jgi:hypothetical protein